MRLLLTLRFRSYVNGIRAARPALKWVGGGLSAGSLLLFFGILIAFRFLLSQTAQAQGPAAVHAMVAEADLYLFLFLLAGAVPFVSGVLFTAGDLALLAASPIPPAALVVARLFDAVVVSSAQFVVIGIPLLIASGWALGFSALAWVGFVALLALFIALPALIVAALLLAMARVVGLRHVRAVVALCSVLLSVGLCLLLVSSLSGRAAHGGPQKTGLVAPDMPLPQWLPSSWMTEAMIGLGSRPASAFPPATLLALGVVLVAGLSIGIGGKVLAGEALLEGEGGGRRGQGSARLDDVLATLPLAAPTRAILTRDLRYIARDLVLLSQIGIPLILFLVPFAIGVQIGGGSVADSDLATLTLGTIGVIAFMETSILSLSSVGLEGRGFWMALSSPVSTAQLLRAKWMGAYVVSLALTIPLLLLTWGYYHIPAVIVLESLFGLTVGCAALCGFGVGISGLFPRFVYDNPAHRASLTALIWGFVGSTTYVLLTGVALGGAFSLAPQWPEIAGRIQAVGIGVFLVISLCTGVVPLLLATARLRAYAWEE